MTLRLDRVLNIARRDLRLELNGRRGLILPIIAAGLLIPAAVVPNPLDKVDPQTVVTGDAPESVRQLPKVTWAKKGASVLFEEKGDRLIVHGNVLPKEIRNALDGDEPELRVIDPTRVPAAPGRSMLFALISASVLTGALSETLPGERSRGTLESLLTAYVSRAEIIVGKWAAWSGFGMFGSLFGAAIAIATSRIDAGLWLLPMVLVAPSVVALGLFLVRNAEDAVSGSLIALRVLPAVLAIAGLASWGIGSFSVYAGAAIPLGGALMAAGNTWPGLAPPIIASISTGGVTAGLLVGATIGLEARPSGGVSIRTAGTIAIAASCWWTPFLGPMLWAPAGNATLAATLPRQPTVAAAGLLLICLAAVHAAKGKTPGSGSVSGVAPLSSPGFLIGVTSAAALCLAATAWALDPGVGHDWVGRLASGWSPTQAGIAAIIGSELVFRGVLYRQAGPAVAFLAWVVIITPHAPLLGILSGVLLWALRHATGSIWSGLVARCVAVSVLQISVPSIHGSVLVVVLIWLIILVREHSTHVSKGQS
jgi:hypothetical protein